MADPTESPLESAYARSMAAPPTSADPPQLGCATCPTPRANPIAPGGDPMTSQSHDATCLASERKGEPHPYLIHAPTTGSPPGLELLGSSAPPGSSVIAP